MTPAVQPRAHRPPPSSTPVLTDFAVPGPNPLTIKLVSARNHSPRNVCTAVQWQVPDGWYLRSPVALSHRDPMAIYYRHGVLFAYQYLLRTPRPGVTVLQ